MKARAIRNELRQGQSASLDRRRKIILLAALGLIDFSVISLYQTGVIKKLPDLPFPVFDSNKVNAAEDAYMMGAPDGPISAVAYSLSMVLAAAGGSAKTGRLPAMDLALGGVIAGNAAGAVYYLANMLWKQKKVCLYCVAGAAINLASAIIIAPTVFKAIRRMSGR